MRGETWKLLSEALLDAFPSYTQLAAALRGADVLLSRIASAEAEPQAVVYRVIEELESRHRVHEVVAELCRIKPSNALLREAARALGISTPTLAGAPALGPPSYPCWPALPKSRTVSWLQAHPSVHVRRLASHALVRGIMNRPHLFRGVITPLVLPMLMALTVGLDEAAVRWRVAHALLDDAADALVVTFDERDGLELRALLAEQPELCPDVARPLPHFDAVDSSTAAGGLVAPRAWRALHGCLLEHIVAAKAAHRSLVDARLVVAFDATFTESDGAPDDRGIVRLRAAIRAAAADNVLTVAGRTQCDLPPCRRNPLVEGDQAVASPAALDAELLSDVVRSDFIGHVLRVDPARLVLTQVQLRDRAGLATLPTQARALHCNGLALRPGDWSACLPATERVWLRFARQSPRQATYASILTSDDWLTRATPARCARLEACPLRTVFVGVGGRYAMASGDMHRVAVDVDALGWWPRDESGRFAWMPGVYLHHQTYNALGQASVVRPATRPEQWCLVALAYLLGAVPCVLLLRSRLTGVRFLSTEPWSGLRSWSRGGWGAVASGPALVLGLAGVSWWADYLIGPVSLVVASLVGAGVHAYPALRARRQARALVNALARVADRRWLELPVGVGFEYLFAELARPVYSLAEAHELARVVRRLLRMDGYRDRSVFDVLEPQFFGERGWIRGPVVAGGRLDPGRLAEGSLPFHLWVTREKGAEEALVDALKNSDPTTGDRVSSGSCDRFRQYLVLETTQYLTALGQWQRGPRTQSVS